MKLNRQYQSLSLVLITSLLFFTQASFALPPAFQADYSVSKGRLHLGNLHASLTYSGNQYSYQKNTRATGLAALLTGIKITENTNGKISGESLKPDTYLFNQSRRNKSRIDKVKFTGNKAVGSYKGRPYQLSITPGTHDRASLELVLARDLSHNKKNLQYPVVTRGEKTQYNFQILGQEKVNTPAGIFNTTKVKVKRSGNKRDTTFWMAKELGYIPVKIRHREKGDTITSVIKNYKKL